MKRKFVVAVGLMSATSSMASGAASAAPVAEAAPSQPNASVDPKPATADSDAGLGDIVVTAQRRSESLQRVPLAATAISAVQLQQKGVTSLLDIPNVAPNLNIETPYGNVAPEITLRGVGSASFNENTETTVAIYLDDVVLNAPSTKLGQMFDLSRVEVLRGPQGTLYGKNSTGGAINLVTRRPDGTTEVDGAVTVARFGTYNVNLGAQTALSENLSVRIAGNRQYSDGYAFNTLTNQHLNNLDNWGVRLGARYKSPGVDIFVKAFFDDSKSNGAIMYPQGVNADGSPRPDAMWPHGRRLRASCAITAPPSTPRFRWVSLPSRVSAASSTRMQASTSTPMDRPLTSSLSSTSRLLSSFRRSFA